MGGVLKRSLRHWSMRFLWDRAKLMAYTSRYPETPWLTRQAIEFLESWLKPTDRGLEWGSGRSTLWLASRVGHLTSVEHDQQWFARVKDSLEQKRVTNCRQLCLSLNVPEEENPEYISVPAELPNQSLDFVLVDGRLRDRCMEVALRLLKPGGLLILDNAARYVPHPYCCAESAGAETRPPSQRWIAVLAELENARRFWTSNGIWATSIYLRPAIREGASDVAS